MTVKIPDNVDFDSAPFSIIGSIGMQSVRLIKPEIGETMVVFGLGLVGLMTVQILIANGVKVIGLDFDQKRCELAESYGATVLNLNEIKNPVDIILDLTKNIGADGILITASSASDEIIHQAALMCRKRARIILVGVVGLNIRRDDFYEKEISFQVSSSYGPGRYDPQYEEEGLDYPLAYVRWTSKRNIESVLDLMSSGAIDVKPLISHEFKIEEAEKAYDIINDSSSLGVLINYCNASEEKVNLITIPANDNSDDLGTKSKVGFLGMGNYATRILLPAFAKAGSEISTISSSTGLNSFLLSKKYSIGSISTSNDSVLDDHDINTIVISTRHDQHALQVVDALKAGKNVFVEKPLCLNIKDLNLIEETFQSEKVSNSSYPRLMIGFNRRFAPFVVKMKELIERSSYPLSVHINVNAGQIPDSHWTQNLRIGGGRLIGEACHFIDLASFLSGSEISDYSVKSLIVNSKTKLSDSFIISFSFKNGSYGSIHYSANGGDSFPKERIEVHSGKSTLQMNNYRSLIGYNWPGFRKKKALFQDKGQNECVRQFVESINSGKGAPINSQEIFRNSKLAIQMSEDLSQSS
jgi:predicted dehydrogenase